MEWTEDYLFTYIDTPLQQVMYWKFDDTMWNQGHFGGVYTNGSLLVDPWSQTGNPSTPFDQPFFLILNVAVGSRNGWFPDGVGGKKWTDAGPASDFYSGMSAFPFLLLLLLLINETFSFSFYFYLLARLVFVSHSANCLSLITRQALTHFIPHGRKVTTGA